MLTREIHSLQHPFIKHLVKLRTDKEYRHTHKEVLVTGIKLVKELSPSQIFVDKTRLSFEGIGVSASVLEKITGQKNPEGVAGLVPLPQEQNLTAFKKLIAFDRIQDPGNLGTLIRTALALGFEGAILLNQPVDPFNEKVIAASKGAVFRLPMATMTLSEIEKLPHTWYVASPRGTSQTTWQTPSLLILGNESKGSDLENHPQAIPVSIPMKGDMESLNVAIAGAILMYQMEGGPFGIR
ncbi:MAG: RNA methyltransferase [Simkaniaceae bacterium]|nr:RNA methyltransferase [Simkaniaceae bacterium]